MSNRCRRDLASYIHEHDGSGGDGGGTDEAQWRTEVLCQRCSSTDVRRVEHVEHAGRMAHAAARDANVCREAAAHTQVSSSEREREPCDCCRAQGRAAGHGGDAIRGPTSPEKHRAPERVRRNSRGEGTHGGLCRNKPGGPKSNPTIGIAYPQQKAVPQRRAPGPRPPVNGSYRFHVPRIPEREAELQKEDIDHRQRGEAPHFHARPPVGKCPPLPTRTIQQQQHDASPQVFPDGRTQGGAFREELGPVAHIPHFHRSATAATPWGFASAGGEAASSDEGNLLLSSVEASLLAQSLQAVCRQQRPLPRDSPPEPLAQGPYSLQQPPRFCHREHSVHRLPYGEMHSVPFPCTVQLPIKHFPLPLLQQSTLCHHGPIAPWVERTHPSAPFSPVEPSDDESSGPAQAAPFGFQGPCLPTFDGSATSNCGFLIQKHGSLKQMPAGFSAGNAAEQVAGDGVNGTDTFLLPPWELQEAPLLCVEADKGLPFLCGQEPRLDQLTHGTIPKNSSSISGSSVGHQEQHMSQGPVPLGLAKLPWQQIYHTPITTNQNRIELSRQLSKQHLVMSALAPQGKDCADRKHPLLPLDEVSAWRCEAVEGYSGAPQGPVPTFPPHESQEPKIPGVFSLPQVFFGAHVSRGKAAPVPIRSASMAASLQMSPSCTSSGGPWLGRARAGPWGCEGGVPPSEAGLDLPAPGERQSQLDAAGQLLQDSLCRVMGMHVAAQNQQSFLNSLNGASLDGLDVFLTCRQCDKNFVDVASLLQHRQTCSVPTGPSANLLESMTTSISSSSCRSAMQQPASTQLPEGGGVRSFECSVRASSSVCTENIPAKANKDELSVNLSQLATAPGHLAHTTDLDMDDAARLDSLIIETLNGLGYHTDDGELDSSFIEAFTDEDALVPRRAGDVAAAAALPQPPESTAKVTTRDSDVGKRHEETAPTATAGRGGASRHRGRRGRGKDMRQLYHTSRSKKKQRRGRWAALPVRKRNGYNLTITTPVTCVPTTSVCLRQDVLAPSPDSSSSPLPPHHTSSHHLAGATGGCLGDGALDGNTCGKDGLSADMVEPESLSSRPEKPLPSVSKPIAHRSIKHVDVLSRRGMSGRLNKELIHKIVLQKNNFYKVRMKPWRSPLDKLKLVLNIPKSVVKDQLLSEYDYISDTDTDHDLMGAKGIKIDLREVPLKQPIALSERLNIVSNTQTTTNVSLGKNRLQSDTVQQLDFFEHQKESHAWKEQHNKDTELGMATEHCKHDGGSCASSGEAAVSREEESQPGMDRGSLGGICSPGLQGGPRFHEGASLQALTSPCWRLEDRERWSDAMSCESGSSRDNPTQNWEPGTQHSDSTRSLQLPLPAVSPGASHSLASTALEVFDLGGSASPQLPFPSGGHLGKTAAHFDAEDILEALQLSELGERSRCEPIEASKVAHATDIGQDGSAAHVDTLSTTNAMEKEWSFLDEMSSIFSGNFDLNQELNSNLAQPLLSHGGKLSMNMESNFEEQTVIGSTEFHMADTFYTPPLVQGSKTKNIMDTIKNITDVEHLKKTALHNDTCICTSESSNRISLGEGQPAECVRGKAQSSESVVAVPSDAKTKPISFLPPVLHCDFWTGDFHPFSPCFDEAPSPSPDSRALTVLERYLPCNNSTSESGALTMSPETRSIVPGLMMRTTTTMPLEAKLPQVELGQLALQAPKDTNFLPSAPLSVLAALCHSDAPAMVAPCGMLRPSDSEKLELSQNGNVTVCKYTGSLTAEQEAGRISLGLVKNLECDQVHTQPAVTCDEAKCLSENVTLNGVPELSDESPEAAVACIKEKAMVDLSSVQGDPPICSELEPRDSPYFPTDGAPGVGIHSSRCQMPMNTAVGLHDVLYSPISPDSFVFSDAASCDGGSETDIVSGAECGGFAGGACAREDIKPVCRSLVQLNEDLHVKSLLDSSTLDHSPKVDPEIELMDSIVKSVESSYAITKENVEAVGECIIESEKSPEMKRPKATCEGLLFASEHISLGHRSCNFSATTVAESVMSSSRACLHSSSGDPCPDEPQQQQQQPQASGGNRCHLTNAIESPRRRRNSCPSEGAMGQQLRFAKENGECITSQSDAVPLNILHSSQNESKTERALETKAMNPSGETCLGERGNPEAVYLHAEPHRGLPTKSAELLVTLVAHHEQELNRTAQHWGLGATRLQVDEGNSAHPVAFTTNRGSQPVELGDRCEAIGEQDGPSCLGSSLLEFTATGGGRGGYEGGRDHGGAIVSGSHEHPRLNTKHTGPDLDQPVAGSATKRENHSLDYEDAQTVPLLVLSDTFGKSPADIEVRALSSGEPEALEEAPQLKKGTHSSSPDPGSKIMSHPCPHSITQAPSSPSIEVITGWGPEEASSLCNVCQASFRSRVGLVRHKAIRHNEQVQLNDISHVKEDAVEGTESVVAESAGAAQEGILHPTLSMLTHNTDLRWPHKKPVADIDGCSRPHIAHLDSTITTTISQVCNADMATTVNSSRPVQPELSLPQCGPLSPCTPVVENTTQAFVESLFQFNELDHIPAAATHESSGTEMDAADNSPKRPGGVGESVIHRHRLPSLLDGDAIRDLHAQSDADAGLVKMWEPRAQPRVTEEDEEVGGQRTPEPRSPFYSTSAPRVMPGPYDQNKSVEDEEDKENEDTERQDMASHVSSREEPMVLEDHGGRSFDADLYQGPCSLQASLPLQDSYPGCPSVAMFSGILEEREENGSCNGNRHPECIPEVAPMEMMGQCELTKSPMLDLPEDPFIEAIERHLSTVRAHADAPRDVPMRCIAEPSAEEPHICDLSSATAAQGGRCSPALDERLLPSFVEERRLFSPSPSDASEALVDAHLLAEPLPPGFLEGVLRELADEIKTCSRGRHEPTMRNRDKQYKCRACFQWFLTLGELDFHKLSHIPAPPPTCYMCVQRKFSSREQLREHLREKHCKQSQQRTWSCGMCLKELSDMWMYNEHLREHAAQFSKKGQVHKMALMMAACNDEYGARDSDNDEERGPKPQAPPLPVGALPELVDGTGVDAASISPDQGPSGAQEGLATKVVTAGPEQGPEQGPTCELAAARIPAGGVHPDCKDPSRDCHHCGKQFPKPFKLQRHLVVHSLQRAHVCQLCPVVFLDASDLRAHLGAAHGVDEEEAEVVRHVTIYDCEQCADVMHVIKKSFICSACNYTFSKKEQFDRHMDKHLTAGGAVRAFRRAVRPRELPRAITSSRALTMDCGQRPKRCKLGVDEGETLEMFAERSRMMFGEEPDEMDEDAKENPIHSERIGATNIFTMCVARSHGFQARIFPSEAPADDDGDDDGDDDDDDDSGDDDADDDVLQGNSCFTVPHSPPPPLTEGNVCVDEVPMSRERVLRGVSIPAGGTDYSTSTGGTNNSNNTRDTSHSNCTEGNSSRTGGTISSTGGTISCSNSTANDNNGTSTGDVSHSTSTGDADCSSNSGTESTRNNCSIGGIINSTITERTNNSNSNSSTITSSSSSSSTDISNHSTNMGGTNNTSACRGATNNSTGTGGNDSSSSTRDTRHSASSSTDTGGGTNNSCSMGNTDSYSTSTSGSSYSDNTGDTNRRNIADTNNSISRGNTDCNSMGDASNDGYSSTWGTRTSGSTSTGSIKNSINNSSIGMDITDNSSETRGIGNSSTSIEGSNARGTRAEGNGAEGTSMGVTSDTNISESISDNSSSTLSISGTSAEESPTGVGTTGVAVMGHTSSSNRTGDNITEGTSTLGTGTGDTLPGGTGQGGSYTLTEGTSNSSSAGCTFMKNISSSHGTGSISKGGTITWGATCSTTSSYNRKSSPDKPQRGPKRPCDSTGPTGGCREAPSKRLKVATRAPKPGHPNQTVPHHGHHLGLTCGGGGGYVGGVGGGTGGRGTGIGNVTVSGSGNGGTGGGIGGTGGGNVGGGVSSEKVNIAGGGNVGGTSGGNISGKIYGASFGSGDGVSGRKLNAASGGNVSGTFSGTSAGNINGTSSSAGASSDLEDSRSSIGTLYTAFFSSEVPGPHRRPLLDSLCGRSRTGGPHTARPRPALPASCKSAQSQRDLLNQMFGHRLTTFKIPLRKECKEQLSE